jgi:O-antigen ligase
VLDALDLRPTTPRTATYYGLLCAALLATTWHRRRRVLGRLRIGRRAVVIFIGSAALLSGWFLLNTALFSDGELAMRLAALLVLWTIPTALVALSFRAPDLHAVAKGLVVLSLVFVSIEALAIARSGDKVFRFTPIADLDAISAGLIPALGAVAALCLRPSSLLGRASQMAIVIVLAAAVVVPGSRGPVLALVGAALALALVLRCRVAATFVACLMLGLGIGSILGSHVGSFGYLTSTPVLEPDLASPGLAERPVISTLSIRRQWIEDALADTPERPIFGHGVGMFVDDTPEAHLMGVAGQRTYPHNTFVEAAYSLGALGLFAYLAFVGSAAIALISVIRRWDRGEGPAVAIALPLGIGAFAFVNTNVSGEIGADALLWSAAAIAVALYADSRVPGEPG